MDTRKLYASGRLRFSAHAGCAELRAVNVSRDVVALPPRIISESGLALPLTGIGQETFYQTTARCIILPGSVVRIGPCAFSMSPALQAVYIPASVRMIDRSSFSSSENVVLHGERGSYAERYAQVMGLPFACGLPEITAGMNRDVISGDWVYRLSAQGQVILREYTGSKPVLIIPAQVDGHDVVRLDSWCFDSLDFLQEVIVPEGVTSVGQECFGRCTHLENVTLPASVQWLEAGAFANCSRLHDVVLSGAIRSIPALCFAECCSLRDLFLPADLRHIGSRAFIGCSSLEEASLPQGVEVIDSLAFCACTALRRITLSERLISVAPTAFEHCERLYMPRLPDSLPSRYQIAFRHCIGAPEMDPPED